jgi:glycine/D-amino acid oxidase-like deaminating enzyme
MQTDVLIIGQGICGTFLSRELERAGLSYVVIDEERSLTASRAAAGLINPVTGRRLVKTWMIDELLPFAQEAYRQAGEELGVSFLQPARVVDFFPKPQMRLAFLKRMEESGEYVGLPEDEGDWRDRFSYDFGYGWISPCYLVDMQGLLAAERRRMAERGVLRAERFMTAELVAEPTRVRYRDVEARWAIFCDGIESSQNAYFSRLPFAPNKGEVLVVEVAELGAGAGWAPAGVSGPGGGGSVPGTVFKKGMSLVPWKDGLFWVGSSYEWSFADAGPTAAFRERTEAILREWLRVPFRVVEHIAAVRPATLERRPFVGFHPLYPAVGILNGMGTKGCSLAPYFARQLVQQMVSGVAIQADADILRFRKVLGRG